MLGEIDMLRETDSTSAQKRLVELSPVENKWLSDDAAPSEVESVKALTKARRYTIDPRDMLLVQKQAREKGLNIIGVYHSHPDNAAIPSECDRAQAWSDYAYIIVSVNAGKAIDIRNWTLDVNRQFQSEAMNVSPSSATDRMPLLA